ncbi:exodeoxyribonuclease III [Usitatibacter palustris]|uniref:Exodeoxyribonuclease n=1 Tax=Usitatibacter palustris TaxID=2732487 RepID=A0A6M4HC62_9PROT|nr:exodeoxyribonuclease III [Usitatibacter palustris]QJR16832.1 Exodeoxyribonuclease [Usitatibacter palustris]
MRIVTLNVNGLRSAAAKGFAPWMRRQKADVVCLQEIKAQEADLPRTLLAPRGLHAFFHPAEKRGYSGVAIYARKSPDNVVMGLGIKDIDAQGRFLQVDFGKLSVISLYLPSGSSGEEAQARKFAFMKRFLPRLEQMRACGREIVLCGDWNIAHKEIDLRNWRSNQKNSGFLPEERAWLTEIFERVGWIDVFRALEPGGDHYTFWSSRGDAYNKNVGWRIDYQIATPGIAKLARSCSIYKAKRFSDHAPLTIDYDCEL